MNKRPVSFSGKTALVTGGTRGIGRAIAGLLAELGSDVIYTGTGRQSGIHEGRKFIRSRPQHRAIHGADGAWPLSMTPTKTPAFGSTELTIPREPSRAKSRDRPGMATGFIRLDLSNDMSVKRFLAALKKIPKIDILVNNAGINVIEPIQDLQMESWDEIIKVNLTGPALLMKEVSAKMIENGRGGRIVNVSSIFGLVSRSKRDSYSASKAGLIGLTRAAALDLAPYGILVNALCPGFTLTDLTRSILSKDEMKRLSSEIPLGRFAREEEIAASAVFLCSDLNTYITGQAIAVDGGFTAI